jgi:cytochrome c-type biogenesis protein CcmF
MVIHPPVLFLGFASTLIPFAYAVAGLWKKDYTGWTRSALPWSLFSGGILGLGILMGGAWAYEALSFGGFWAWDPVENASLVPWLTMVAGIHTLVVFRHSKHGLRSSFLFMILSFGLVLLSTYLTRSGVLGTSSVHSFTDAGLKVQLIGFLLLAGLLPLIFLFTRWRKIPEPKKEEKVSSREFWMFVGSLVLGLSALQIGFSTCLPIFNILVVQPLQGFFPNLQEFTISKPVAYYNKFQILFAIMIGTLTAIGQYFRYRDSPAKKVLKKLSVPFLLALVLTILIALPLYKLGPFQDNADDGIMMDSVPITYFILLFATLFTVIANFEYLAVVLRKNWKMYGGSITHVGFGLLLLGALISQGNQKVISVNRENIDFGPEFQAENNNAKNRYLAKGKTVKMGDFEVTYLGRRSTTYKTFFDVHYKQRNEETGEELRSFVLSPFVQEDGNSRSVSANPSTKRLWDRDIFTHVSSVPIDTLVITNQLDTILVGDTILTKKNLIVLEYLDSTLSNDGLLYISARLNVFDFDTTKSGIYATPRITIDQELYRMTSSATDSIPELGYQFNIEKILPVQQGIILNTLTADNNDRYIIMKAIEFPYINILWLGCVIMVIGFFFSILRRVEENKKAQRHRSG